MLSMENESQSENVPLGTWTDVEEQRILIAKLEELRHLLSATSIDTEKTFGGEEPFYKPVIDGKDQELARRKLMKSVAKL
jgi:hypothetical protein